MQIITRITEMQNLAEKFRQEKKIIGLVPTMGYLHEGHLSLVRLARKNADLLVVSIFVNPTQFAEGEDLDKYPRDFERDKLLCEKEKVDVIFYPDSGEMYSGNYLTYVEVEKLSQTMCGITRPAHFRGVTTVVCKLFHAVKPHLAVFGQKDFQQAAIIKHMVKDLNFDIQIITAPIIREEDGLALSSRNKYLNAGERENATVLFKSLQLAKKMVKQGIKNPELVKNHMETFFHQTENASLDYIAIVDRENLSPVSEIQNDTLIAVAVYIGSTRLIDNLLIQLPAAPV
jgi:pantoate--beta-alanine ligase